MISCLVPTIPEREPWLERCVAAIEAHTSDVQIVVERGGRSWGEAINLAAEKAIGDYLWLGSDDMEVCPGWWKPAANVCDRGQLPAPLVFNTNGTVQSAGDYAPRPQPQGATTQFPRIPFCSVEQWRRLGPLLDIHFADVRFGDKAAALDIPTVVERGYAVIHHMPDVGRRDYNTEEAVRLAAERKSPL